MGRLLSTEERARAEERRWADGLEGETESQTDEMMDRASGSEMNWKEEGGGEVLVCVVGPAVSQGEENALALRPFTVPS